jgi:hypothetical protein
VRRDQLVQLVRRVLQAQMVLMVLLEQPVLLEQMVLMAQLEQPVLLVLPGQ